MGTLLSTPGQISYDLWQRTKYAHAAMAILEFIEVAPLQAPVLCHSLQNQGQSKGWFFMATSATLDLLNNARDVNGQAVSDLVAGWQRKHGQLHGYDGHMPTLCMQMLGASALMSSFGLLEVPFSQLLPVPAESEVRRGMRLDLAKPLLQSTSWICPGSLQDLSLK